MKLLALLVATALIGTTLGAAQAHERRKDGRRTAKPERSDTADTRRSTTVDRRGLCVRDTGRPLNSLSLNNTCDREEFWARFNDLGGDRR